jgi:hypothetical protein
MLRKEVAELKLHNFILCARIKQLEAELEVFKLERLIVEKGKELEALEAQGKETK